MQRIPPTPCGADESGAAPSAAGCFGARAAIVVAFGFAVMLGTSVAAIDAASAQTANGILAPGNAVVTGFSGVKAPAASTAGANPVDLTEIDLAGPSARIVDLQSPGAPPQAQLINAPKPFTATAAQIGQVFAVTLDDATPPNVYVAATSAYGLPIIAPAGGGLARVRQGAPNAQFMPGLFGPAAAGGGPGSIWRIDGATGEVKLLANVMLDGVANSGAALGGLAFDPASHTLFVADRGTGMIHAFDQSGAERARFDHGVDARTAAGLPPLPYDAAGRLDITKPAFKTDDPATWGYAARDRRIFGLAAHAGRLYYATADEQVWSVAIAPNGAFGTDVRVELQTQPWDGTSEISKIAFDDQGGMLLAERPGSTGAYDFNALAREGVGRVLHYQQVAPVQADQAAPGAQPQPVNTAPSTPGPSWQPVPDEYAIGFPRDLRNGNGGVAIGYSYTPNGVINRSACGGFLWSTGEQLRVTTGQALAGQLAAGGPAIVNGLQGNAIEGVRPANVPPLATYFVDYDDQFADPAARGHMGDIAIWRVCSQAFVPAFQAPSLVVPVGFCQRDQIRLANGDCCERRFVRNGRCGCPPDTVRLPNGECCPQREIRNGTCCTPEEIRNGKCCPPDAVRLPNGRCCTPQEIRNGKCCTPEQIRNGQCCPPDTIRQPNGQCCTPEEIRAGRCGCPPGQIRLPNGTCCDPKRVRDGRCVPPPSTCPPGQILTPNGTCCDPSLVRNGRCVPPPPPICPSGQTMTPNGCQPPATLVPPRRHWFPPRVRPPHRDPGHGVRHWTHRDQRTMHAQPHVVRHFGGNGARHRR
jgi:hypothetical protein